MENGPVWLWEVIVRTKYGGTIRRALATGLLILWLLCPASQADGHVTTTGSLNMRKGPGLDYRVICSIEAGTRLPFDRTSEDDRDVVWYRVSYEGRRGWVSSKLVQRERESDALITTTNDARLRSGPGTEYASRLVIDAGTVLAYDRIAEDRDGSTWYRVRYRDKSGWVSSRYVRPGTADIAGTVTTIGDVHLRSGPSLEHSSRDIVPEGAELAYDRTEQDARGVTWYRVGYAGMRGWISSVYAREGSASDARIRTTGSVHLRAGAGLDYESRCVVDEGVTLTYDRTEQDARGVTWYHVNYKGTKGWVSSRFVERR